MRGRADRIHSRLPATAGVCSASVRGMKERPGPPHLVSRRWLLAGTAAIAVTAAGCTTTSSSSSTPSASTTATVGGAAAAGSVAALAQAFYNTLGSDLQASVLLNYSLDYATRWSNLPQGLLTGGGGGGAAPSSSGDQSGSPSGAAPSGSGMPSGAAPSGSGGPGGSGTSQGRVGINLGQLNDEQLAAFDALLKAATGTSTGLGYDEIQSHLYADDYLGDNGGGDTYGRENFYVALLGSPQDSGTWQFQFGGHHLAVSHTYIDGKLAGATPSFRGVEPNGDFEWDGTTYNVLKVKLAAFTAMLKGLTEAQLTTAKLADSYTDLVLGAGNDWAFPTAHEGLQVSALSADQKKLVLAAIATYVNDIAADDAATILAGYEGELDDTYVAYSGTTALTERNDYVRVDGPSVWIELSMQNGVVLSGNHPHSVWRDRADDYGGTKS